MKNTNISIIIKISTNIIRHSSVYKAISAIIIRRVVQLYSATLRSERRMVKLLF